MLTILILSILVLLHELGHFLIAKLFGVHVLEFGIGLPPKALKLFKQKETEYTLNWLPIGGFVRLAGEDSSLSMWDKLNPVTHSHMYFAKPAWQRALIVVAGVVVNFLVGIVLFSVVYTKLGIPQTVGTQVMVTEIANNSPAEIAGIEPGQVVSQVGEVKLESADQFVKIIGESRGKSVNLYLAKLDQAGQKSDSLQVIPVIPRENPPEGEGALGVGVADVPILIYEQKPWHLAPFYAGVEGMKEAWGWSMAMIKVFLSPRELMANLGGPVAVVKVGEQVVAEGWISSIRFAGIISLNLAIFNLLPIPALDGGRLLMIGLEKVVGRKRVIKYERYLNGVGMFFLIALLIGVTIKDVFFP